MTLRPALACIGLALALLWGAFLWADTPRHFRTRASWYGWAEAGKIMANGRPFDPTKYTCASPWLPMGVVVRVTNLRNGLSVVVVVTDRGPHKRGRGIDLSRAAAEKVDMIIEGVVPVEVEVVR